MSSWTALLAAYLLGGLTFIPLVLGLVFLHAYLTLPVVQDQDGATPAQEKEKVRGDGKKGASSNQEKSHNRSSSSSLDSAGADIFDALPPELKSRTARTHVPDVAAGYFAVCREYVPGGINGKPPERTTPAGSVVAAESPSVYQAMYRSIFERGKNMSPTLEVGNGSAGGGKKRGRNVFYVVLRLGILMLYDDSEQLEVRHVISLAHYDVDIYSGGGKIPEGELWIKRNCIRLTHRKQADNPHSDAKPYFLFSDNCSDKEDFYHAMLQSQDHRSDIPRNPPRPLKFETTDLVRLVQQLHASEENLHTRWINALIGRLFLAMYKTDQVEQFIWNKITKKIARVPKPALISKIDLQKVDMGSLPPFITNPKLRELTVDGDLTVEADVSYKGNFRVEISAVARIELGSRFKNRDFTTTLGLAATLKKLEGHILLRVKPPPSNRLWMTFEAAPRMELALEPIWGSRQITYGPILRAMESRLREVVGETLVLPNWDDFPFKDTEMSEFRGGIWGSDGKKEGGKGKGKTTVEAEAAERAAEHEVSLPEKEDESDQEAEGHLPGLPRSGLERKLTSSTATVSTLELTEVQTPLPSPAASVRPSAKPKAMRSSSFASAASPIVNVDAASASATKVELKEGHQDAAAAMKTISLSQPGSPTDTPVGSPPQFSHMKSALERGASPSSLKLQQVQVEHDTASLHSTGPYSSSSHSAGSQTSIPQSHEEKSTKHATKKGKHTSSASLPRNTFASTAERGKMINQSINSAASAAKKWWNNKQQGSNANGAAPSPSPLLSNITNGHKHGPASASPLPRDLPGTPLSTSAPDEALHGHGHGHGRGGSFDTAASVASETTSVTSTSTSTTTTTTLANTITDTTAPLGSPANPIGRGQLIPESGVLSPKTERKGWAGVVPGAVSLVGMTKRKPVVQRKAVGGLGMAHAQAQGIRGGAGAGEGEGDVRGEDAGKEKDQEREKKEKEREIDHHPSTSTSTAIAPPSSSRPSTSASSTTATATANTNFSTQQHHQPSRPHGHERKTSVGTAAMGMGNRKKSSSIQSLPSSTLSAAGHGHGHGHGHGLARRQRRAVTESAGSTSGSGGLGLGIGIGIGVGHGDGEGLGGRDADGVFVIEAPREVDAEVEEEHEGEEDRGRDRGEGRKDAERQGSVGSVGSGLVGALGLAEEVEEVEGSVFRVEDVVEGERTGFL